MSLQWTVARAVGFGLVKERLPFLRTAKGGATRKGRDFPAFWEAMIGGLLLVGAARWSITNYKQVREINLFALVLVVQSLPFLRRSASPSIEGTRFNAFAYWRGIERQGARFCRPARRQHRAPQPKSAGRQPRRSRRSSRLSRRNRLRRHHRASAVSASRTQYDVPIGITSSLKL